jgi:hypothetical protein
MQIHISEDMIKVVSKLLGELDHDELEAAQFGQVNGHEAANFFAELLYPQEK